MVAIEWIVSVARISYLDDIQKKLFCIFKVIWIMKALLNNQIQFGERPGSGSPTAGPSHPYP